MKSCFNYAPRLVIIQNYREAMEHVILSKLIKMNGVVIGLG